jgi:DNA-binding transcriptional regulator YiaG
MNLAGMLKDTMRRLAKREIKAETGKTRQAVAKYRRDIARLKRDIQAHQKEIAALQGREQKRLGQPPAAGESVEKVRFSARSVAAQRKRLKLSAADYGKLLGVSGLTVYSWERGSRRPRKAQLVSLAAARKIGKREARARLDLLTDAGPKGAAKVRKPARRKRK